MLGQEDNDHLAGGGATRRAYLRSVSWTDRLPTKPNPKPQSTSKTRSCLPPLQPLSITRRPVEEWPRAGSDDLGVWPNPQTPRESVKPLENSNIEQPVRDFQFKKDKLAFFDKECSRIADHIYLGSDAVAKNREILRQNGITHVLNCVGFVCPEYFKNDLVYKTLWLQDTPSEDITSILYDVFDYFEDVREQGGRVLVHCFQGVSRSTSLVIAYLMWREGQSFEDAFQYVKAARGVTNPNMGFACQLLQCQKRVHAAPASPNSVLRMYRMAPHSPYDPLHLVPKLLSQPGVGGLDSRGAFIVHVPTTIFVWEGMNCNSVMSNHARTAANQVIRYERAQGPIVSIKEGEEPSEFWDSLAGGQILTDGCNKLEVKKKEPLSSENNNVAAAICSGVGGRKVDEYDLDFELFHKALAGGVVPPFSVSNAGSETCLPARENGWGRLRQKFANGMMKEFITSSKLNCDIFPSTDGSETVIDSCKQSEQLVSLDDYALPSSPSAYPCGSPDSFDCFPNSSPDRTRNDSKEGELSVPFTNPSLSPPTPCDSPDSFSCFPDSSPKFGYKSPTLSPSTSDYSSSSFTFSPSSSNWSDLSYLSSRQPSPSGLEATDPFYAKNAPLVDNFCLPYKETSYPSTKVFSANSSLRAEDTCLPCKGSSPSIAERRGSNPPPRMLLSSVDEPSQVPRNLVRTWSFSLPDLDDGVTKDICSDLSGHETSREEQMLDADIGSPGIALQSKIEDRNEDSESHLSLGDTIGEVAEVMTPVMYQWPTMSKVEMHCFHFLDSGSVYFLLAPDLTLHSNGPGVVYVWLGQNFLFKEGQSELTSGSATREGSHLHWEVIVRDFLNQIDFPVNATVQVSSTPLY